MTTPIAAACPSREDLEELLAGSLLPAMADAVRSHATECAQCQAILGQLTDQSDLGVSSDVKRQAAAHDDYLDTPELQRLLADLHETPLPDTNRAHTTLPHATTQRDDLPPNIGPYRIQSELGRGGMGIVYRAFDPELERHVALKVLRADQCDERSRQRIVREARAVAALRHDHVVAIHSVSLPTEGPPYLVMEYIAGPTLQSCIQREGRLDPRLAADLCRQIADGLEAAHRAGLIHRDIKPSNIILEEPLAAGGADQQSRWRAKIMDFGLVRMDEPAAGMTQAGAVPGTPEYMSPEQIRTPEQIDHRSDVYSLGVTLYEALGGMPPFRGPPQMVMRQVLDDEPLSLRRLTKEVPSDLETICLKAMAKEPARRYPSAADFRDDLRRWISGEPIRARPVTNSERGWRWCRRHPREATLLGTVAALLVVMTCGAMLSAYTLGLERNKVAEERNVALRNLRDSYLSQAQARRWSGQVGQRFHSLEVLAKAAEIRPGLDLRNEAVACIPLVDLKTSRQWQKLSPQAFDSNLERYARGDLQGNIRISRVADDVELTVLPGFGAEAYSLIFSPDEHCLAAAYRTGGVTVAVEVWDLGTRRSILKIEMPPRIENIGQPAFSSDGRQIAINAGDGVIRLHQLPSGGEVKRLGTGDGPVGAVFHPREAKLAVSRWWDTKLQILDSNSGVVLATLQQPAAVNGCAWRPDGRYLAIACADNAVRIWDMRTETLHRVLTGHQNQVTACTYNRAGDLLASCGWDVMTRIWDPTSGRQLLSTPGYCFHFDRDDRRLAYGFFDVRPEAGIWDVATGRECRTLPADDEQGGGPWSIDIHPEGRLAVSTCDDGARLWDLTVGHQIGHLAIGSCRGAMFTPNGNQLVTSSEAGIQRFDLASDWKSGRIRLGSPQLLRGPPNTRHCSASLSRDGEWLFAVAGPDEAAVINIQQPSKTVRLFPHVGISNVAISADGRWAVTGAQHGVGVKVWDAQTGKVVLDDTTAGNYGWGIFSPDGQYLFTGSSAGPPRTWNVGTWNAVPDREWPGDGAFSEDGRLFAARTRQNSALKLIDVLTGQELMTLSAPNSLGISGVCFSRDGSRIAATCNNFHVIQLWDVSAVRRQLAAMKLDSHPYSSPPTIAPDSVAPLQVELLSEGSKSRSFQK